MKNFPILLFIFLCYFHVHAQRTQAVYVELAGAGIFYTVNYDTRFSEVKDKLGGRIGLGVLDDAVTIPFQINYLFGANNHKFEFGAGLTPFILQEEGVIRMCF